MEPQKRKVGLFTFGITLILIGTVYIVNLYTNIPIIKDLYLLWPIFLIMLGLEFIITKLIYDRKKEYVRLSPSVLSIFLVVLILGVTFLWQHIPDLKKVPELFANIDYYKYNVNEPYDSGAIELKDVSTIKLDNTMGLIEVKDSADGKLRVSAMIKVRTNDEAKAREYSKDAVKITQGTNTTIETKRMYDESHILGSITVDYTIQMPKNITLTIINSFGSINVSGLKGALSITNKNGTTYISNIEGDVNISNSFGSIVIGKIMGNVVANNTNGSVIATEINGEAHLTSAFGKIAAQSINGNLFAHTKNGEIVLSTIVGDIDAATSFGAITVTLATLDNVALDAQTRFGSIIASDFNLQPEKDTTTSKLIKILGNNNRKIQLKTNNGSITIRK